MQLYEQVDHLIPISWSLFEFELSPLASERYDYYEAEFFPTTIFGGTSLLDGWDCTFLNYQEKYEELAITESPFEIEMEFNQLRENRFEIIADVEVTQELPIMMNKIFFVITNWIEYTTDDPFIYLVVAKSFEQDVELFQLGSTAAFTTELDLEMAPDWNLEDLRAVAIIQSWDSKKILQAAQLQFGETIESEDIFPPANITLHQNYPNPFNPSTTINYDLNQNSQVKIDIYNAKGQIVSNLINTNKPAGVHSVVWNGTDKTGQEVPSGLYFYRLIADITDGITSSSFKKMILLK